MTLFKLGFGLLLCLGAAFPSRGQTMLSTQTITTPQTYTNSVEIVSGDTVTINNTTVTFNQDVSIPQRAVLIVNNSTLKMGNDKRIILSQYTGSFGSNINAGRIYINNNSVLTSLTSTVTGSLWRGIECVNEATIQGANSARVTINNSTIQYARCAFTNFNPVLDNAYNGRITALNATFKNNLRSLNVKWGDTWWFGNAPDSVVFLSTSIRNSSFLLTPDFPYDPADMVYLNSCPLAIFNSCTFKGKGNPNFQSTTGINAINSGLRVEKAAGSTDGCFFNGLKNGVVANNTLLIAGWVPYSKVIISNSMFHCRYAINLSGCQNPMILGNNSFGPITTPAMDFCSIFLRNCTGYRVEGNFVEYDIGQVQTGYAGIVVMNSGTANNEIYRNTMNTVNLAIQSLGTNKAPSGLTGLKLLCNNVGGGVRQYDISVMNDVTPNGNNGIHRSQYVQGIIPSLDRSAANRFTTFLTPVPTTPKNYYLEPGTNIPSQFLYKYYTAGVEQNPVYRSPFTVQTANANSCPVQNVRPPQNPVPFLLMPPPPPFNDFVNRLQDLEARISDIEGKANPDGADSLELESLLGQHSALVDSTVAYYLDAGQPDSVILVCGLVTKNYNYQLLLAAAYAGRGQFDLAMETLNKIPENYNLSPEEQEQIEHLARMYSVLDWLRSNHNKWDDMPSDLKESVYDFADKDAMYAGATARSLLVEHEGREYDPIFRTPTPELDMISKQIALNREDRMYPNPAQDHLFLDWTGEEGSISVTDLSGRILLSQPVLPKGANRIDIRKLHPGIYLAVIKVKGRVMYQQKIVKL